MIAGKDGNLLCSSHRIGTSEGERLKQVSPAWLQVFHQFPPPDVWEAAPDPLP